MNIKKFLQSLLPSFEKSRLMEDAAITLDEIKEVTEPLFENAADTMKNFKPQHPDVKAKFEIFRDMTKQKGNPIEVIAEALPTIRKNVELAAELIKKMHGEDVLAEGLTFAKVQLIQFVEACGFASTNARRFLNYVIAAETSMLEGGQPLEEALRPADIKMLEENFITFCQVFAIVSESTSSIERKIGAIPDVVVTAINADAAVQTLGNAKVDPLGLGFVPTWMNPIYFIGLSVAEWQHSRYKASREELKLLQLRLLNLKRVQANKPDANLQKQIEYYEKTAAQLNFKIQEMERKYA